MAHATAEGDAIHIWQRAAMSMPQHARKATSMVCVPRGRAAHFLPHDTPMTFLITEKNKSLSCGILKHEVLGLYKK